MQGTETVIIFMRFCNESVKPMQIVDRKIVMILSSHDQVN